LSHVLSLLVKDIKNLHMEAKEHKRGISQQERQHTSIIGRRAGKAKRRIALNMASIIEL
jgi:hypothetical protein